MDGLGILRDIGALQVIYFNRQLAQPPSVVWRALSDPDELRKWWGEVNTSMAEGGYFAVRWLNTDSAGNGATMTATISELDEGKVLETVGDRHGTLRWELEEKDGGTNLHFSSTLDLPDEYQSVTMAGWHFHLDALETVLNGGTVDLVHLPNDTWNKAHKLYARR